MPFECPAVQTWRYNSLALHFKRFSILYKKVSWVQAELTKEKKRPSFYQPSEEETKSQIREGREPTPGCLDGCCLVVPKENSSRVAFEPLSSMALGDFHRWSPAPEKAGNPQGQPHLHWAFACFSLLENLSHLEIQLQAGLGDFFFPHLRQQLWKFPLCKFPVMKISRSPNTSLSPDPAGTPELLIGTGMFFPLDTRARRSQYPSRGAGMEVLYVSSPQNQSAKGPNW